MCFSNARGTLHSLSSASTWYLGRSCIHTCTPPVPAGMNDLCWTSGDSIAIAKASTSAAQWIRIEVPVESFILPVGAIPWALARCCLASGVCCLRRYFWAPMPHLSLGPGLRRRRLFVSHATYLLLKTPGFLFWPASLCVSHCAWTARWHTTLLRHTLHYRQYLSLWRTFYLGFRVCEDRYGLARPLGITVPVDAKPRFQPGARARKCVLPNHHSLCVSNS